MPTDNPKISLYVPQAIYDRFVEFTKEQGLSMSQAGTVLLAEYFGLQETLKETTEGTTIGGVTLDRVEFLERQVSELFDKYNALESSFANTHSDSSEVDGVQLNKTSLQSDKTSINNESVESGLISNLLSEPQDDMLAISGHNLSSRRFGLPKDTVASKKRILSTKDFVNWTKTKDPDGISWEFKGRKVGYIPCGELSSELRSKLLEWMKNNIK